MRNNRQAPPVSGERLEARELNRLGTDRVRTYRNVSRHDVYGHATGEVMELTLTEGQHNALVEGGALVEITEEELPADAEAALAESVTTGEEATVVKQEAAEEISADESHEGEQA